MHATMPWDHVPTNGVKSIRLKYFNIKLFNLININTKSHQFNLSFEKYNILENTIFYIN